MPKQRVRFYIDPDLDHDLVAFLQSVPRQKRSKAIRHLLRQGLKANQSGDLEDRLRAVVRQELRAAKLAVAEVPPELSGPQLEDDETRAMVDSLVSWGET